MTYLRTGLSLTATLALSVAWLPPAFAQEGPGFTGTLSFSQGLEISDNDDLDSSTSGSTFTSRTGLRFAARSDTRAESLRFNLGTEIVGAYGGGADDEFNIENSSASIQYTRRGASAALSFSARYVEYQLDETVVDATPSFGFGFGSGDLIFDQGKLQQTILGASLETGIGAPFGTQARVRFIDNNYTDTNDPDNVDSQTTAFDGLARFRINPALTARALAGISVREEYDILTVETEDTYIGAGLAGETAGGLSFTGDVFFDQTETTNGLVTVGDDGIGMQLTVSQDRPTGALGFDVSSRITDEGRRSAASVNRSFDMRNGEFSVSLGLVDQEADDSLRPRANIRYRQDTLAGGLTASLSHEPTVDDGNVETDTRISVDFSRDIDDISGWSAGLTYSAANSVSSSADDSRASATVAYSRSLTEEWRMRTGVEHIRETSDSSTESSNSLFFNIERDITFGF